MWLPLSIQDLETVRERGRGRGREREREYCSTFIHLHLGSMLRLYDISMPDRDMSA